MAENHNLSAAAEFLPAGSSPGVSAGSSPGVSAGSSPGVSAGSSPGVSAGERENVDPSSPTYRPFPLYSASRRQMPEPLLLPALPENPLRIRGLPEMTDRLLARCESFWQIPSISQYLSDATIYAGLRLQQSVLLGIAAKLRNQHGPQLNHVLEVIEHIRKHLHVHEDDFLLGDDADVHENFHYWAAGAGDPPEAIQHDSMMLRAQRLFCGATGDIITWPAYSEEFVLPRCAHCPDSFAAFCRLPIVEMYLRDLRAEAALDLQVRIMSRLLNAAQIVPPVYQHLEEDSRDLSLILRKLGLVSRTDMSPSDLDMLELYSFPFGGLTPISLGPRPDMLAVGLMGDFSVIDVESLVVGIDNFGHGSWTMIALHLFRNQKTSSQIEKKWKALESATNLALKAAGTILGFPASLVQRIISLKVVAIGDVGDNWTAQEEQMLWNEVSLGFYSYNSIDWERVQANHLENAEVRRTVEELRYKYNELKDKEEPGFYFENITWGTDSP